MTDKREWDELGFNPIKDGFWATTQDIRERMKQKDKEDRISRLFTAGIIIIGLSVLTLVCLFFI
tara:strand:+ start:1161 stop:1352 length:192 start_codon:yes stop_codon:yes gene_type:complete